MTDEELVASWQDVTVGVARAKRRIDRAIEDAGVPAQWFAVLHLLLVADNHRLPMSVLARDVSMTSGGFTKLADRMAREGLIDRRGSVTDRRVVNATLTEGGLKMAQRAVQLYQNALRECLLGVVSSQELAGAAQVLGALGRAHEPSLDVDEATGLLATERDPALPDRRGRGRGDE